MAILVVVYLNVKQNKLPFIIGQERATFNGILNAVRTLAVVAIMFSFKFHFQVKNYVLGLAKSVLRIL